MRGGRTDATQGGASGVPEPDQDITSTFARMAAAGYNQTAMIQFTACGHTIGSVHHGGFPLIVPASAVTPNNTNGGIPFE
jgi:catalase (peroxidase I)